MYVLCEHTLTGLSFFWLRVMREGFHLGIYIPPLRTSKNLYSPAVEKWALILRISNFVY